jgi:hypothetical protein
MEPTIVRPGVKVNSEMFDTSDGFFLIPGTRLHIRGGTFTRIVAVLSR